MTSFPAGMPRSFSVCRICYRRGVAKLSARSRVQYMGKTGGLVSSYRPFFRALLLSLDYWRWSRPNSGWASILFFLAFERIPVRLSHFEESRDSQFLAIASRKRD